MRNLTQVLREVLQQRMEPLIQIERATGVPRDSISRFVKGEQSMRLDLADKLAEYLNIQIVVGESEDTTKERKFMGSSLLPDLARIVNKQRPGSVAGAFTGHHFNVGDKLEPNVWVQVLELKTKGPHRFEIGLAFDSNCKTYNDRNAHAYKAFLAVEGCPFGSPEDRHTAVLRYFVTKLPIPMEEKSRMEVLEEALRRILWFQDRPYGNVKQLTGNR